MVIGIPIDEQTMNNIKCVNDEINTHIDIMQRTYDYYDTDNEYIYTRLFLKYALNMPYDHISDIYDSNYDEEYESDEDEKYECEYYYDKKYKTYIKVYIVNE